MFREMLRYIFSFLLPLLVFLDLRFSLVDYWLGPLVAFCLIPLMEQALPRSRTNVVDSLKGHQAFDFLLFLNLPVVFGILALGLNTWMNNERNWVAGLGIIVSTGLVLGVNGINVAHELGHLVS